MHSSSYALVQGLAERFELRPGGVLEVGSLDVNGSYRNLEAFAGAVWLGVDEVGGEGVDVVGRFWRLAEERDWSGMWDLVLSGQALEHDPEPWTTVPAMAACTRPGGHVLLVAPFTYPFHHPPDYWRFTDQGLAQLFRPNLPGEVVGQGMREGDAWCVWRRHP